VPANDPLESGAVALPIARATPGVKVQFDPHESVTFVILIDPAVPVPLSGIV
jgi:hypothetical protein